MNLQAHEKKAQVKQRLHTAIVQSSGGLTRAELFQIFEAWGMSRSTFELLMRELKDEGKIADDGQKKSKPRLREAF